MCIHARLMCEKVCKCFCACAFVASPNTVILQEHSNCPIHRPWGPFIAPMTNRSILQLQRCQLPLFKQTIRRRVRWQGWTMLEMTVPGLSLPLSPTFSLYYSWCRAGQSSEPLWILSQSPKFQHSPFLPVDVLLWQHIQEYKNVRERGIQFSIPKVQVTHMTNKLNLLLKGKKEEGRWHIGVWRRVILFIMRNLAFFCSF